MKGNNSNFSKKQLIFAFALVSIAFFAIGWNASTVYRDSHIIRGTQVRENSIEFQYINPLLFVDNSNVSFSDYKDLEGELQHAVNKLISAGNATKISVYYRDLNTGRWAGVNEKDLYIPSSMLKVATLIAYLDLSRTDPKILDEKLHYSPTYDVGQHYKPSSLLPAGDYKASVLLQETILKSENQAVKILTDHNVLKVLDVYRDLRLPNPIAKEGNDSDFMSPEQYSNLFRVLYNSTYLPESYSESALKLLSATEFNQGIVSGVASSTVVAHKFGEHTKKMNGIVTERQLHDCGIIYYPEHPYFLCVMTKGEEFEKLEPVLPEISKIVFEYLNRKYRK